MFNVLRNTTILLLTMALASCAGGPDNKPLQKGKWRIYDVSVFDIRHLHRFEDEHGQLWTDHVIEYIEKCALPAFAEGTRLRPSRHPQGLELLFLKPTAPKEREGGFVTDDLSFSVLIALDKQSKFVADRGDPGVQGASSTVAVLKIVSGQIKRNKPLQKYGACPSVA